ncbi:envelope stress response membrane protein PspC [Pseudidiomarina sp. 1APP75-27a]|uniref:envelope stress response membrane protein PspC n=1 Tax=Pseudidiomarina terrestris TaxID=2820060 RepID=UPI002B0605A5|nr:envelope stress response membrane protein PspC [Pseudidiomarina sp. 1APP75-27a]MEA3587138.1 envelope stress response membrane protein PspC [Pseudidiomarina sp. 1APP75-27a]
MSYSDDYKPRKQLLRDKKNAKVGGVCAGIANYFNIEAWLVRIIVVTAVIFGHGFVLILYIAAWMILDEKSAPEKNGDHQPIGLKTKVYGAGEPPRRAYKEIDEEFRELEDRLQQMERYITSNAYQVDRELKNL